MCDIPLSGPLVWLPGPFSCPRALIGLRCGRWCLALEAAQARQTQGARPDRLRAKLDGSGTHDRGLLQTWGLHDGQDAVLDSGQVLGYVP